MSSSSSSQSQPINIPAIAEQWLEVHTSSISIVIPQKDVSERECYSNTAIIGKIENILRKDEEIKKSPYPDPAFKINYASGCTTILSIAQKSVNYNPFYNSETEFNKYLDVIIKCPFFTLNSFQEVCLDRKEKNWKSMLDDIVGLYDGVMEIDKQKIKNSIVNLIKSACSQKHNKSSQKLFFQSVIEVAEEESATAVDEYRVQVYFYYTVIELSESHSKTIESLQTNVLVKKIVLEFNKDLWFENCHLIGKENASYVTDWLKNQESAKITNIALPCME